MSRTETITQKIPRAVTGLNGSLFVHVDHLGGRLIGVRFSEKSKDENTLDTVLTALGDAVTEIAGDLAGHET